MHDKVEDHRVLDLLLPPSKFQLLYLEVPMSAPKTQIGLRLLLSFVGRYIDS